VDHLRAVLVVGGTLRAADDQLVTLQRWITSTIATRADPGIRRKAV
jgi:hypothetical protein